MTHISYGCQSMVQKIDRIIIKHPKDAFINQNHLDASWKNYNYTSCPDYNTVLQEYRGFEEIIKHHVSQIHYLPQSEAVGLDSIYTHDPVKITHHGAILMHMGKQLRQPEPGVFKEYLQQIGIPILGAITGKGRMEGGDVVWLDRQTVAIARGYRTNDEAIQQFKILTRDFVKDIIEVHLPHADGPRECLHLMSIISLVDTDLAVIYSRYMPVPFRELLIRRGIRLIEVDDAEYDTLGSNVLTLAPRKCLIMAGNDCTKQKMLEADVEVYEYQGQHLSLKGTGGPTCLTCPVLRI
jgi:arginine deiminase